MTIQLSDDPLTKPEDDLLGVARSARIMAERLASVSPPFTAGVYGEWGAGKTSFVWFVATFLTDLLPKLADGSTSLLFIPFSAWQYKTADEIWRALILTIARKVLNEPDAQDPPSLPAVPISLFHRIKHFLSRDALVIQHGAPGLASKEQYSEIADKLDRTLYGGIGKGANAVRLDSMETTLAITNGIVAAMAGVSPLVAAVRSVFGINTELEPGKLIDKGQNESTRRRIESMEEFKKILKNLFDEHLRGRRVFVFVDDLDRCMPDVALDLLEAIKIFLHEIQCIFVVAADETLIGQGLRMRFRDLPEPADNGGGEAFVIKKGREYFEKIIQLPVRLPRPGAPEIQRFIGAKFPEWSAASDLIDTAIGTNPRRLKQYCERLQYQWMIRA
jgi:hypothetical protein